MTSTTASGAPPRPRGSGQARGHVHPHERPVVQNVVVIPVVIRHAVFATGSSIRGFDFSPFSGPLWRIVYWTKEV